MKNINLLKRVFYLFTCIILFTACSNDFLELAPKSNASVPNFYKTQADYETAIVGVYGGFSGAVNGLMNLEEYRADNLTNQLYFYNEYATNVILPNTTSQFWDLYRTIISPANMIINNIDNVEMDATVKNKIKGEAYFFRGYAYYTLNMWFGGVPKVTTNLSLAESYKLGRSTETEIWDLVEADLNQAYSLLPPSVAIGRVDKYDAGTYLAKAYMMHQKWSQAKTVLADVYTNSGAALETNWSSLWTLAAEKTSKEYMLSIINSSAVPNNAWAQQFLYIENAPGLQGNFVYKPGFYESFVTGDIRRDGTLGFTPTQLRAENRKYKFGWVNNQFVGDIVVIRFADVVLLYAEAISMAANAPQQQSLDLMNMTRNRAGLTSLTMANVPTLNDFVEALLAERRSELAFEGHRYSDLKRHNKLVEKVNAVSGFGPFNSNYNYVPIPQTEIDKSDSGVLVQNPK